MRLLRNILAVAALLLSTVMSADEGFWLVQDINPVLENNMRAKGLKLRPKEIYNVDAPGSGLADAVVSLGFKYSGSIVSNWGLVLTCADPAITFMDRLGDVGQQLLKDYQTSIKENWYWMNILQWYVERGMDKHTSYEQIVKSQTPESIAAFARELLSAGNKVEVVMTPEE